MSTHNLCFGAKITEIGIPLHIKVGYISHGEVILMQWSFIQNLQGILDSLFCIIFSTRARINLFFGLKYTVFCIYV